MLRRILIFLALVVAALRVGAVNPETEGNSVEARAARFFEYREWLSAGALYTMLLGDHPTNSTYYGRAIVSAGMLGDSTQQIVLTRQAFDSHVAVDSLFTAVERTSFSIGQTSLYEHYLLRTKADEPWLTRIVDGYLMRYYSFRRDPAGMIAYSRIMLEGNPDNEQFLYTLAQGHLLAGQTDEALDIYRRIVEQNPRSLDALLYLANYYLERTPSDPSAAPQALALFSQARSIIDTPYINAALLRLRSLTLPKK